MTTKQDAIEAAARAIWNESRLLDSDECRELAQAAVTAYLAAREAEGFVMVPVVPTNGMLGDGWMDTPVGWQGTSDSLRDVWDAMLAARLTKLGGW